MAKKIAGAAAANEMLEAENLDKVKEILFGAEKRDTDKKLSLMENMLRQEVSNVQEEMNRRFDSLESYVKKEFASLTDQLLSEQKQREKEEDGLSQRLSKLDEQSSKARRELRDDLLQQSKTLRAEIRDKFEELSRALQKATNNLSDDKTSRSDLAALLMDMAVRLSKDADAAGAKK
jgi:hypothetical protein